MIDNYITGANGFIGSHLRRRLQAQETVCVPHADINDVSLKPYERFFFLSTYGNMADHDNWTMTFRANISDLSAILLQPESQSGKPFVFVSSSSVLLETQTPYSQCKSAAEKILMSTPSTYRTIIVRPYSVTGCGEQSQHLIPRLIHCALTGETMPFCPGPTHDFVDVEDIVDGLLLLSENGVSGIYELGSGQPITNEHVKFMVQSITGKTIKTSEFPWRPYDDRQWFCKSTAASRLGWTPKKLLVDSIAEMVEAYRQST